MTLASFLLILVSVTLSALAQIAFKIGVSSPPHASATWLLGPLAILSTPGVLVGLALYAVGTILWLSALGRVELSQAYPFVGMGLALTTFAGWWLFGDQLSPTRLLGISLVAVGILFIARS